MVLLCSDRDTILVLYLLRKFYINIARIENFVQ